MSWTPREVGTLVVVILKARNLPNKRHIGKQDPYCSVIYNGEKRRTKAIKKGGQHPEWDEEVRFTLFEDLEDQLARTTGDDAPPPPPPKEEKEERKIKGGKNMRLFCFADDPREPDLIGECVVDLTEVLTKGETDEWFTLTYKERYCGEVYLEMTFWSNEPAPKKASKSKAKKSNKDYGGPGEFVELPAALHSGPQGHSRIASTSTVKDSPRRDSMNSSSSSLPSVDLYVAPYEQRTVTQRSVEQLAGEFGEFGLGDSPNRRDTFPPPHHPRPSSTGTYPPVHGYAQSIYSDSASTYGGYDNGNGYYDSPNGSHMYGYQPPYDVGPNYPPPSPSPSRHAPRHSFPTASSGFMPIPAPSGFVPITSQTPAPSAFQPYGYPPPPSQTPMMTGYAPPPSQTPMPTGYAQTPSPSGFVPLPSQTPAPSGFAPIPSSTPMPQSSFYPYPPASAPPPPQGSYIPPQPPASVPPPSHSAPIPQHSYSYPPPSPPGHPYGYPPPSPPHEQHAPPPPGSRPLPEPQLSVHRQSSLPIPPHQPPYTQNGGSYTSLGHIPPPPPLPHQEGGSQPFTPPPPPAQHGASPNGRELPQPPIYPGPPPPLPQPPSGGQSLYPGPPPRPPLPPNGLSQFIHPGPPPSMMQ